MRIQDAYLGFEVFHPGSRVKEETDTGSLSTANILKQITVTKLSENTAQYYP